MRTSQVVCLSAVVLCALFSLLSMSFYLGTVAHDLHSPEHSLSLSAVAVALVQPFVGPVQEQTARSSSSSRVVPEGLVHLTAEEPAHRLHRQKPLEPLVVKSHDDVDHEHLLDSRQQAPPGIKHVPAISPRELNILNRLKYWNHESKLSRPSLWPTVNEKKYLVFQTWRGGFNNERMSLELAVVLAISLGRVLVLPPHFDIYLLAPSHLGDYFNIPAIQMVHPVLMFEEWLALVGIEPPKSEIIPPEHHLHPLWNEILKRKDVFLWEDTDPTAKLCWMFPDAPKTKLEKERASEWCLTDSRRVNLGHNKTITRPTHLFIPGRKLFDHYFSHFWFKDEQRMAEMLRIVRDHVHYVDRVVEIAAKIISRLPDHYNAIHARRGDFQYEDIREYPPAKIIENTRYVMPLNEPMYLATDNTTTGFIEQWKGSYPNGFWTLSDFDDILKEEKVPKIWLGLLDQLILTQANLFVGSRLSTFSAFAVRMRGFMGKKNVETYFTTESQKDTKANEEENGLEGHTLHAILPTWRNGWSWATWGRDFKEPFEFCGYGCLKRGQMSP